MSNFCSSSSYTSPKVLKLNNNQIISLDDFAFEYMTETYDLNLSNNKLSSISSRPFFDPRNSITSLNLSNNQLLNAPSIPELESLEVLNLGNNKIRSVDDFHFYYYLVDIDLSGNLITSISTDIFSSNPKLRSINLSDNSLCPVSEKS